MTIEEAKNILINRGFVEINGDQVFDGNKWRNAITVISKWLEQEPRDDWYDVPSDEMTFEQAKQAVKDLREKLAEYLEQEPCEDCISRQEAILQVQKYGVGCFDAEEFSPEQCERFVISKLTSLPSVTPKEKIGKWINDWEMGMSECSCCGETYLWEDHKGTENFHFCPNCGAKMVESQESEDKE